LARDGIIFKESDIQVMRLALRGTAAYPEPSARITCILELFAIRKIAQGSQPEGDQELLRYDEGIGRAAPRRPGPRPGQSACMQPPDQVAADVLTKDLLQRVARDRRVVGNSGQHSDIEFVQAQHLIAHIHGSMDGRA
jgi:hypothetical protein